MTKTIYIANELGNLITHFQNDPRFEVLKDKEDNFLESSIYSHDITLQSKNLKLDYRKEIFIEGSVSEEEHEYLVIKRGTSISYVSNHGHCSSTGANNLKNEIDENA